MEIEWAQVNLVSVCEKWLESGQTSKPTDGSDRRRRDVSRFQNSPAPLAVLSLLSESVPPLGLLLPPPVALAPSIPHRPFPCFEKAFWKKKMGSVGPAALCHRDYRWRGHTAARHGELHKQQRATGRVRVERIDIVSPARRPVALCQRAG